MEILLDPTSNKLMVTPTKPGRMIKPYSSHRFIANGFNAGNLKMEVKVQKQNEPTQSGSEETLSASPIRQAHPESAKKPATVIPPEVARGDRMSKRRLLTKVVTCACLYPRLRLTIVLFLLAIMMSMRTPTLTGELLKRHEQLNHDYVDLQNRRDTDLAELERLRSGIHKTNQDKDEITKKFTLLDNAHSECTSQEKELLDMMKELERERDE
nr:hypothetical protein [Tanacetum cinerariifolium]